MDLSHFPLQTHTEVSQCPDPDLHRCGGRTRTIPADLVVICQYLRVAQKCVSEGSRQLSALHVSICNGRKGVLLAGVVFFILFAYTAIRDSSDHCSCLTESPRLLWEQWSPREQWVMHLWVCLLALASTRLHLCLHQLLPLPACWPWATSSPWHHNLSWEAKSNLFFCCIIFNADPFPDPGHHVASQIVVLGCATWWIPPGIQEGTHFVLLICHFGKLDGRTSKTARELDKALCHQLHQLLGCSGMHGLHQKLVLCQFTVGFGEL